MKNAVKVIVAAIAVVVVLAISWSFAHGSAKASLDLRGDTASAGIVAP